MRTAVAEHETALPIDDSDGGCDDPVPCSVSVAWTRQHPAIVIAAADAISDRGDEIYNLLRSRRITNVFMTGVHANMCVLARPFGIRQMVMVGMNVVLVRDLSDYLYNPAMGPRVSRARAMELVVGHIEKYWCPSISSRDIVSERS